MHTTVVPLSMLTYINQLYSWFSFCVCSGPEHRFISLLMASQYTDVPCILSHHSPDLSISALPEPLLQATEVTVGGKCN